MARRVQGLALNDPAAYKCFELCEKLGIKNMHVHKGPTIIPLNKDAFDVHDVDHAATDFQDLNWIVEHCGLPRLDDFCWIAAQETNVYGGLAVALPFIHARPRYFAEVIAELLFWLGPDKILFGSRLRDLDAALAGREVLGVRDSRRHRAGARRRPDARDQGEDPGPQRGAALRHRRRGSEEEDPRAQADSPICRRPCTARSRLAMAVASIEARRAEVWDRLRGVIDPELDEPVTDLGFVERCRRGAGEGSSSSSGCRPTGARPTSRS